MQAYTIRGEKGPHTRLGRHQFPAHQVQDVERAQLCGGKGDGNSKEA